MDIFSIHKTMLKYRSHSSSRSWTNYWLKALYFFHNSSLADHNMLIHKFDSINQKRIAVKEVKSCAYDSTAQKAVCLIAHEHSDEIRILDIASNKISILNLSLLGSATQYDFVSVDSLAPNTVLLGSLESGLVLFRYSDRNAAKDSFNQASQRNSYTSMSQASGMRRRSDMVPDIVFANNLQIIWTNKSGSLNAKVSHDGYRIASVCSLKSKVTLFNIWDDSDTFTISTGRIACDRLEWSSFSNKLALWDSCPGSN